MFKYDYVDPKDFDVRQLLEEGAAKFEVVKVFETDKDGFSLTSSKGSPMLKLTLRVEDCLGAVSLVDEYLVSSVQFKIKQLADAVGLPGMYNKSGIIDPQKLIGLAGECLIKNDSYTKRDGSVAQSSKIASFLAHTAPKNAASVTPSEVQADDIPF